MTTTKKQHDVLLGIDLGTTVLKVAAFDSKTGRLLAESAKRLSVKTDDYGAREQDPKRVASALKVAISNVKRGLERRQVTGIGLAAQGGSAILANRETGDSLTPMLLWNDSRPREFLDEIAEKKPSGYWRRLSWRDVPGMGLARIRWFRKHYPTLFRKESIYVGAGEYLYFVLTGLWRQDAGNALQIGCYNVRKADLDKEPLDLLGVPLSFVAPMRRDHELNPLSEEGAKLLGLPSGIPVAGPYMDHEAGYLSAAGVSDSPLQCSLGTAWVGNFVLPSKAKWTSPFQLVLPSPLDAGHLVVQPLLTGNVAWDWGLENLVDEDHKRALAQAKRIFRKRLYPYSDLVALPWFTLGVGTFIGLNTQTTRDDMLRALAMSMSYEMLRVLEEVRDSGYVDSVVLGGGASKGEHFAKILSTLFADLPVYVSTDSDIAGPRGTLHVFSEKVASAKVRKVEPLEKSERSDIMQRCETYKKALDGYCGSIPFGSPLRFRKGR